MNLWRKITAVILIFPFLLSVTGVLVLRTQCSCTGRQAVGIYIMPESCESLLASHQHLFECHFADLNASSPDTMEECTCESHRDCGCNSPDVQFFKLKNHFTDKKGSSVEIDLTPVTLALFIPALAVVPPDTAGRQKLPDQASPPPLIHRDGILHLYCQPKIPDLI